MFKSPRFLLAILALAAALIPAASASAAPNMEVAVQDDAVLLQQRYFDRSQAYDLLRPMNATRVRFNAIWVTMNGAQASQKTQPATPTYDFRAMDSAVAAARARGIKVLLTITGPAPAWANGKRQRGNPFRPNAKEYGKFVRTVVKRYKGQVDTYALWNEPNHAAWLAPVKEQGKLYRELFLVGSKAARSADKKAKVLIGETAPFARKKTTATPPLQFLRDVTCATPRYTRAKRTCKPLVADGYAHHPYDFDRAPTKAIPGADNVSIATLGRLTTALDKLKAANLLKDRKGRALNVWLTEYGYFARKGANGKVFSESTRAKYLRQAFEIAQKNPRVVSMLQFLLVDKGNETGPFNTAIVNDGGMPKATYRALVSWSRGAVARGQIRAAR
jgi:Cellulase (glycosyl hydrolase family 5)